MKRALKCAFAYQFNRTEVTPGGCQDVKIQLLTNLKRNENWGFALNRHKETSSVSRVQELCESRGGRPGLSVLTSLTVSVDVKQY